MKNTLNNYLDIFFYRKEKEKGFAAYLLAILVMVIMLAIMTSLSFLIFNQQKIAGNITRSNQSYILAEAGIEDVLHRVKSGIPWSSSYSFGNGQTLISVEVSEDVGGYKTIVATGDVAGRIRKVQVVFGLSSANVEFHYGVHVGDLGLIMRSNSIIHGNVFSNGPIAGASNARVYGDVISSGPNGEIDRINIRDDEGGGSAWAVSLKNCNIDKDAYYTTISSCPVGGDEFSPEPWVEPEELPIDQETIDNWKLVAESGGTISGYSLGGNSTDSLGPKKIVGNMEMDSNAVLTVTGTLWVTGDLNLTSNSILQLDPGYGPDGGVIVVDGKISVSSNITFCGSEGYKQIGECNPSSGSSYLMALSTKSSQDSSDLAIESNSATETAIFYANNGFIQLNSNSNVKEVTSFGLIMDSNAIITYETGLANVRFSSGPGAGWDVLSWIEIE